jgi:hypothetical protein
MRLMKKRWRGLWVKSKSGMCHHIIIAYNLWLLVVQVENHSYYVALALSKSSAGFTKNVNERAQAWSLRSARYGISAGAHCGLSYPRERGRWCSNNAEGADLARY